jgi:hypothetical protein
VANEVRHRSRIPVLCVRADGSPSAFPRAES